MRHLNAMTAGALLLALAFVAPGCSVKITAGDGGLPVVTAALGGPMNETEAIPPRRVEVGSTPAIVVDNRVGRVTLRPGEAGVVVVEAVKRAATKEDLDAIKLGVEKAGDTVTIRWDAPAQAVVRGALDITVKAPAAASLQLKTGNGSIEAEGFGRGAEASTGVGSIAVKDVAGDLRLHTGNGSIEASDADGAVDAETGVGSVTVKGAKGSVKLHTGNGSITVEGAVGPVSARTEVGRLQTRHTKGDLTLRTGNGSIEASDADGRLAADTGVGSVDVSGRLAGPCEIMTGNGRIVVALPAESGLAVDASTGNGSITTAFGLPVSGRVSRKARGTIGNGSGGTLRLQTGVGSIELKAR